MTLSSIGSFIDAGPPDFLFTIGFVVVGLTSIFAVVGLVKGELTRRKAGKDKRQG